MLEPDPKLLDPALPSASSLPGAFAWTDHRGREGQVERGRFACHRPHPHPSLGLPPRLTEPLPVWPGNSLSDRAPPRLAEPLPVWPSPAPSDHAPATSQ